MKTMMILVVLVFPLIVKHGVYAQEKAPAPAPADTAAKVEDLTAFSRPAPVYDSEGKRDPFTSLAPKEVEEKKKIKGLLNYESAVLHGIVKTDSDKYALVMDTDGYGYVLREGYMVYGGYVTSITDDSVYLHIVKYGRALSIILRLESSKNTVIVEEEGEQVIKRPGINITYEKSQQSRKNIGIEDVVVPSISTKTLEEKWFGRKSELPVLEQTPEGAYAPSEDSFSLYDPPGDSWIKLPHLLKWTTLNGSDLTYMLMIDDDSNFKPPSILQEKIGETSYLLIDDMNLPLNRKLFWKVIAIDRAGNERPCRQSYLSFKIAGNK